MHRDSRFARVLMKKAISIITKISGGYETSCGQRLESQEGIGKVTQEAT